MSVIFEQSCPFLFFFCPSPLLLTCWCYIVRIEHAKVQSVCISASNMWWPYHYMRKYEQTLIKKRRRRRSTQQISQCYAVVIMWRSSNISSLRDAPETRQQNVACWQTVWLALVPQFCSAHVNHIFSKRGGEKKRKKKEGEGGEGA